MKKIVIMNGPTKQNELLMACLSILFPECEILIQSQGIETVEAVQKVLEPASSRLYDQRQALGDLIPEQ